MHSDGRHIGWVGVSQPQSKIDGRMSMIWRNLSVPSRESLCYCDSRTKTFKPASRSAPGSSPMSMYTLLSSRVSTSSPPSSLSKMPSLTREAIVTCVMRAAASAARAFVMLIKPAFYRMPRRAWICCPNQWPVDHFGQSRQIPSPRHSHAM